jgi:NADPH:quinone reductase-like Zn-dependent oxidoreductase
MKAYVVEADGGAALREVPTPEPGPGEVRLRVGAVALNHLDLFVRQRLQGPGLRPHRYPHVSGCDVAGVVTDVGPGVTEFAPGDPVVVYPGLGCGRCAFCHRGEVSMCPAYRIWGEQTWGGLAEYAVAPAANLLRLPAGFPLRTAAAAPVAFTTAWRLLFSAGGLRAGESVLIVGVGGGVASAALVLARLAGARIYATSGEDWKVERALALGATAAVNHRRRPFDAWVREVTDGSGVDLVVDSVGAATWRASIRSLAPGGRLCVCGATGGDTPDISIREFYQAHRRIIGAPLGGRPDFDAAMALVLRGAVTPVIHAVYPLEEVEAALAELESARQFGKIVLEPAGP